MQDTAQQLVNKTNKTLSPPSPSHLLLRMNVVKIEEKVGKTMVYSGNPFLPRKVKTYRLQMQSRIGCTPCISYRQPYLSTKLKRQERNLTSCPTVSCHPSSYFLQRVPLGPRPVKISSSTKGFLNIRLIFKHETLVFRV